jgi:hypothetical protein
MNSTTIDSLKPADGGMDGDEAELARMGVSMSNLSLSRYY